MGGLRRVIVFASAVVAAAGAWFPLVEAAPPQAVVKEAPPPDRIESSRPEIHSTPVWVSVDEAIDERRELVRELFMPWELEGLDRAVATYKEFSKQQGLRVSSLDPCRNASHGEYDYTPPAPTVEQLFTHSEVVFNGTVRGRTQGFYLGSPSTLYSVEVDKVWKGSHVIPADDMIFIALPQATIELADGVRLCNRTKRSPDQPQPGGRILVFSFQEPLWPPIINPMDEEVFWKTDVSLSLPSHFTGLTRPIPVDLGEVIDLLEESR